jgi:hypothetical protein
LVPAKITNQSGLQLASIHRQVLKSMCTWACRLKVVRCELAWLKQRCQVKEGSWLEWWAGSWTKIQCQSLRPIWLWPQCLGSATILTWAKIFGTRLWERNFFEFEKRKWCRASNHCSLLILVCGPKKLRSK